MQGTLFIDLAEYWASAIALWSGQNPYDPQIIKAIQSPYIEPQYLPVLMWNPPIIFALIAPLTFLSLDQAVVAWTFLQTAFYVCSALLLSRLLNSKDLTRRSGVSSLILISSFYPQLSSLYYAQISGLMLLGLAMALYLYSQNRHIASGFSLGLTALKPHLLLLCYVLMLRSYKRSKGVMIGSVIVILVFAALAIIVQPKIWSWYFQAMQTPPIHWRTPTIGSWLQAITGLHTAYLRTAPLVIVGTILLIRYRPEGDCLNSIVLRFAPWSLLLSPYGWVYDQVLLLPTALWLIEQSYRFPKLSWVRIAVVVSNILLFIPIGANSMDYCVWSPLVIGILSEWVHRVSDSSDIKLGYSKTVN